MNEYEKALDWFDGNKGYIDQCEFPEEHQELFEKLLHKGIAKKPLGKFCQEICPNCGDDNLRYSGSNQEYNYCPNCGQHIDWSE